jgi:hypothetical protein
MKGKRRQYALKHYIATTVHSAIGHTVFKLATQLTKENSLWERAMVVVLVSRVHTAGDLIFVGDKDANVNALIAGLKCRNQYDEYMEHIVAVLSGEVSVGTPLSLAVHPFRFKDIPLPMDQSGVVYMLVSIKDGASLYIGYTQSMSDRLKRHNSGVGAYASAPKERRPWGLYAYITGFQGSVPLLKQVEDRWQRLVHHIKPKNPKEAVAIAQRMITQHYEEYEFVVVISDDLD